jgi:hypothetical protein
MSVDNVKTVYATFETREAADRAIEHLVQHQGIERSDVFAEPKGRDNTSGTAPSGGDYSSASGGDSRFDAALAGAIQVSVDVGEDEIEKARAAFREAGAGTVAVR